MATITDRIPFVVDPFQVAATTTTYFTSTSGLLMSEITEFTITNDTTTSATLTVYKLPNLGTESDTNIIVKNLVVLPQDRIFLASQEHRIRVEPGGLIRAVASAANQLTGHISGDDVT